MAKNTGGKVKLVFWLSELRNYGTLGRWLLRVPLSLGMTLWAPLLLMPGQDTLT